MPVTRPWGVLSEVIDKKTCDKIICLGHNKFKPAGTMEGMKEAHKKRKFDGSRASDTVWLTEQWVTDLVWLFMVSANENSGWKYDIKKCEALQLTRYKEGGFYNFHKDGKSDHLSVYNNPDDGVKGLCRKLSMSVVLDSDYEGGDFQFAMYENQQCTISTPEHLNKTGSIIVFPSFMEHRVSPITKGVRHSLVAWFLGPPLK